MKTIGIIAEYNPFHHGHAYQIAKSRELTGEDSAVVVVMSGDFVQRGESAITDKFERARAAVAGGADLVLELPLCVSLSSAEGFAKGALGVLAEFYPDVLSFGSETADLGRLLQIADLIMEPDFIPSVIEELKLHPEQNFAAARQHVAEQRCGFPLPELHQPNNTLAIEYLKTLREYPDIRPLAIRRIGAGHDEPGKSDYPSASELRAQMRLSGKGSDPRLEELLILDRLRRCKRADLPEGNLGDSLWREIRREGSYSDLLHACANRRFPFARVRRACLRAALGIRDTKPAYLRVLAFREAGRELLRRNTKTPILTKPADVRKLSDPAEESFSKTAEAHDFYSLINGKTCIGEDWRYSPTLVETVKNV